MKFRTSTCFTVIALFVALMIPGRFSGQAQTDKPGPQHYKVIDLGTLGGLHSYGSVNGQGFALLNNSGVVASYSDLGSSELNAALGCYVPDCLEAHATEWKAAAPMDLGALPPPPGFSEFSAAGSINARGWATGQSQSSTMDPILNIPEFRGVLWKDGRIINLGTLEAGTESLGIYVNNAGQVIGFSTISTDQNDPLGFIGFPTHTFIWQNGNKLDLGTLGGLDAFPGASCSNPPTGIVVGGSSTTATPNLDTGLPTFDPFLWRNGKMVDPGTIGGTNGFAQCVNHRLQIIGQSSVAANPAACNAPAVEPEGAGPGCHAFFWESGVMTDLGTLGGDNSEALWLNEEGVVVGSADLPGPSGSQAHDAVVWINGVIHDLGTVSGDACSRGRGLNARGEIVGGSSDCHNFLHAFISENGGPPVDLNTLIPPGLGIQLTNAFNINDRGEILAKAAPLGFTPNDDADLGHLVLLVPCGEREGDCSSSVQTANFAGSAAFTRNLSISAASPTSPLTESDGVVGWRKLYYRYRAATLTSNSMRQILPSPLGTGRSSAASAGVSSNATVISVPVVTLSPTSIMFSTQAIGTTSSAKTVVLKNTGTASLTITSIAIVGTNAGDFSQTHTCGSSLAAGASCSISVTFKPTASGTRIAALSISDNATGSPQKVSISGTGTTAKLSPTSVNFGTLALGSTSSSKTVVLTNVGTATLTISGIAITGTDAGDFTQTHNCGSSLAASASCSISISFKPTTSETRTAALSVTDNAAGSPQTVSLTGIGTTAKLSPTSLNFETVALANTSSPKPITLTNVGTTALTISGIGITGTAPADFSETNDCGTSLAASASCSISVSFKPTASGTRTAALSVTDNAAGSPQKVSLTGTGTSAELSPTSLNFSQVVIGNTSVAQAVTLTNVGTTTLTISGVSITGTNVGDFAESNSCSSSLAANASCSIDVTFKPSATGTRTAALSVADSAAGSPQTVSLSGDGVSSGICLPAGSECRPGYHCCPGLVCVPASTRAYCE